MRLGERKSGRKKPLNLAEISGRNFGFKVPSDSTMRRWAKDRAKKNAAKRKSRQDDKVLGQAGIPGGHCGYGR